MHANGRKAMIPSSQIWGLAQRSIPNFRRHGNGFPGVLRVEGFVNREDYMRTREEAKKVPGVEMVLYITVVCSPFFAVSVLLLLSL